MKKNILKILLVVLIVIYAIDPFFTLATVGYNDLVTILSDVWNNGTIIILSAGLLYLLGSENKNGE